VTDAKELLTITRQLAAIEVPPPPDWQPLMVTTAMIALIVITTFVAYRRRRRVSRQVNSSTAAIVELNRLHQQWQQGQLDDQRAAYHLCAVLRIGLQMRQLSSTPPPQLKDDTKQWQQTLAQLNQLRYARPANARLDAQLFEQLGHWLARGARPC